MGVSPMRATGVAPVAKPRRTARMAVRLTGETPVPRQQPFLNGLFCKPT